MGPFYKRKICAIEWSIYFNLCFVLGFYTVASLKIFARKFHEIILNTFWAGHVELLNILSKFSLLKMK